MSSERIAQDGWLASSFTIRTADAFLKGPWTRALQRMLELTCSDLPGGRSWRVKLSNLNDQQVREECQAAFLESITSAASWLGRECTKARDENRPIGKDAVDTMLVLFDHNKPLYHYYPTTRYRSPLTGEWETPENEGFTHAYEVALDHFYEETNGLVALQYVLASANDIQIVNSLVKLLSMIKVKRAIPDKEDLIKAACSGLENSCALLVPASRGMLRDVVEEICHFADDEGVTQATQMITPENIPAMESWRKIALSWFRSNKLKLRRAGLEQLGDYSKHLVLNFGVSKGKVTEWLRQERVLEVTFVERPEERVLPCVEELLLYIDIGDDILGMLLQRAGSKAVQRVLGNVCHQSSFGELTSARLLDKATRNVLIAGSADAASLIKAALCESKQTRTHLVRKGKKCALAIVRALVSIVLFNPGATDASVSKRSCEDSILAIEALHQVCQETEARGLRRYVLDLLLSTLLPSESFLPEQVRLRFDDIESSLGIFTSPSMDPIDEVHAESFPSMIRADANRDAAYLAIRRVLSLFLHAPSSYSFASNAFSDYASRSECLRSIDDEWSFRGIFFSDLDTACHSEEALRPRLDLFAFFVRFSPQPSYLLFDEVSKLWSKAKELNAQELFCFWLTTVCSRECNPIMDRECTSEVLRKLFTREDLVSGGDRTFLCIQTLFLEANVELGLLDADQCHEEGSQVFRQSQPSTDKSGAKLVGRRVSVLYSDGRMQQGYITGYKDVWSTHSIEYFTGSIEEKSLEDLSEWWLLPSPLEAKAGPAIIRKVDGYDQLLGLDLIWTMAIESTVNSVSQNASDLLVALHQMSASRGLVNRTYETLAFIVQSLSSSPDNVSQLNRTAMKCVALLRNLDVLSRSAFNGVLSHGYRGHGVPVHIDLDKNLQSTGNPTSSDVQETAHVRLSASSNTLVRDFLSLVCEEAKLTSDNCLLAIDPASGGSLGGLGIPVSKDEQGVDACTLEELGVLPAPHVTRATLGSKSATAIVPRKGASQSLAIVPYQGNQGNSDEKFIGPPPRSPSASPPDLLYNDVLVETPVPSPSPSDLNTYASILKQSSVESSVIQETKDSDLSMTYPKKYYASLFALLDSDSGASKDLKLAVWELLQNIATYPADEVETLRTEDMKSETSFFRQIYKLRIVGLRLQQSVLVRKETVDFVETVLDVLTKDKEWTSYVLPSTSNVILNAVSSIVDGDLSSDLRASELCAVLSELLLNLPISFDQMEYHDCTKVRRASPAGRLCDQCVSIRRRIRCTVEMLRSLKCLLKAGGPALWATFFRTNLAQKLIWEIFVRHPVELIRAEFKAILEETFCSELMVAMTNCERQLEEEGGRDPYISQTCVDFFRFFTFKVGSNSAEAHEMFERVGSLVLQWHSTPNPLDDSLFVCFANLLTRLVPSTYPQGQKLVDALLASYILNPNDVVLIEKDNVRSAVSGLIRAVARASGSSAMVIDRIDTFLSSTPIPLKRQEKGWLFDIDWSVDPSWNNGGGLRLRKPGTKVGLVNRGSTCYANSVIQLLFSVEPFRAAILNAKLPPKKEQLPVTLPEPGTSGTTGIAAPQPPPAKKKQSIAKAWQCWCTGINDLTDIQCRLCEMPRPDDYEIVSESFSYVVPSELMMQFEDEHNEAQTQLGVMQRATSSGSTSASKEESAVEILRQVQRTFAFLNFGRLSSFDPFRLINASKSLNLQFPVTSQNDASEYYDKLLDAMDTGLKKEGIESAAAVLKECFLGKQAKMKRCQVCENVSYSADEEFYRLELTVKNEQSTKNNLKECLEAFTAPEDMFGDNKVDCDFCQTRTNTTFITCLTSIPDFLFIHPKRFTYDLDTCQTVKLNHLISFPEELNLAPYTRESIIHFQNGTSSPPMKQDAQEQDDRFSPPPPSATPNLAIDAATPQEVDPLWYDLKGVLVHRGRAGGGHYYAFIEGDERQWVHFNDDRVSPFDIKKLPEECFGGKAERSVTDQWGISRTETTESEKSAFMLLYVRRQPARQVSVDVFALEKSEADTLEKLPSLDQHDFSEKDVFNWELSGISDDPSVGVDDSFASSWNPSTELTPIRTRQNKSVSTGVNKRKQDALLGDMASSHSSSPRDWFRGESAPMSSLKALENEVEDASLSITKQTLIFSKITQSLTLETVGDCLIADEGVSVLGPAFKFFFSVVAKSKQIPSETLDDTKLWLAYLPQLLANTGFEVRTTFADQLLSKWITAPPFTPVDSEIGPSMNQDYSLAELLLDCPERSVRSNILKGVCILIGSTSEITVRSLVSALLNTFIASFDSSIPANRLKAYLEALMTSLNAFVEAGSSNWHQVILESGVPDAILGTLTIPPQQGSVSRPEIVANACAFLQGFLRNSAEADLDQYWKRLRSPELRDLLIESGLNASSGGDAVLSMILAHFQMASVDTSVEVAAVVDKLVDGIALQSNSNGSMVNDLPYDSFIVGDVFGDQKGSDTSSVDMLARLVINSPDEQILRAIVLRIIALAYQRTITDQVISALENGALIPIPRHTVWEERLFPLDATDLRLTCRLIACLVLKCDPELHRRSSTSSEGHVLYNAYRNALAENPQWRVLKLWFLCASSPLNQLCYQNGLDTESARKLASHIRERNFLSPEEENHVEKLVGADPSDIVLRVEGSGIGDCNGVYRYHLPLVSHFPRWMSDNGLSIYRCSLSNGSEEWFLSRLEPGAHPSDSCNIDYYTSSQISKKSQSQVPHPADWTALAKGRMPAPLIRKILVKDLAALTLPDEQLVAPPPPPIPEQRENDFGASADRASASSFDEDYSTNTTLNTTNG